jgi:cation/acetate symporter
MLLRPHLRGGVRDHARRRRGLTLSGVANLCHDIWTNVVRNGAASEAEQLKLARTATLAISHPRYHFSALRSKARTRVHGGTGLLDRVCRQLRVARVGHYLAPIHNTRRGSILVGMLSSLILIYLSPTIRVELLGKPLA